MTVVMWVAGPDREGNDLTPALSALAAQLVGQVVPTRRGSLRVIRAWVEEPGKVVAELAEKAEVS